MALSKAKGNMYDWCTHMHTHIGGECPHHCVYCSTAAIGRRFKIEKYQGPLRMIEKELDVNYGTGKIIFIEHCTDLFAENVPDEWITRVLIHCHEYPDNTYVFQTKHPERLKETMFREIFPEHRIFGCTIETDNNDIIRSVSNAPLPAPRIRAMEALSQNGETTFITIEPILKCDPFMLAAMIGIAHPSFVNIGADSKGSGLPEPSGDDIRILIKEIKKRGIEIRAKNNLERLMK